MELANIVPITPQVEDAVVSFHIKYADALPRSLARHINLIHTRETLPENLQEKFKLTTKQKELKEIEQLRFSSTLRRLSKARQVSELQTRHYQEQIRRGEEELLLEQQALQEERERLIEQEQIQASYDKVMDKLKELSSRPKQRTELDQLIESARTEIAELEQKQAAYLAEEEARRTAFTALQASLHHLLSIPKVDPERDPKELLVKPKPVSSAGPSTDLSRAVSPALNTKSDSSAVEPSLVSVEKRTLDPKAAVFTPTVVAPVTSVPSANTAPPLNRSKSSAPVKTKPIPGLPSRPAGSYKDVPLSVGGKHGPVGSMTGTTSAPVSRSGTPLGRQEGNRNSGNGRGRERTPPAGRNNSRATTRNMSTKDKDKEDGEMSDREEGGLAVNGPRGGLKRTRGKEEDDNAKRRRTAGA